MVFENEAAVLRHGGCGRLPYRPTSISGRPLMLRSAVHAASCPCCGDLLSGELSRRRFIQTAAAAGATLACSPGFALAATGNYEAMALSCIDPRLQEPVRRYLVGRHLSGKYSHFVIAGASVGVVAPAFQDWHKTFWENLGASVQLHHV